MNTTDFINGYAVGYNEGEDESAAIANLDSIIASGALCGRAENITWETYENTKNITTSKVDINEFVDFIYDTLSVVPNINLLKTYMETSNYCLWMQGDEPISSYGTICFSGVKIPVKNNCFIAIGIKNTNTTVYTSNCKAEMFFVYKNEIYTEAWNYQSACSLPCSSFCSYDSDSKTYTWKIKIQYMENIGKFIYLYMTDGHWRWLYYEYGNTGLYKCHDFTFYSNASEFYVVKNYSIGTSTPTTRTNTNRFIGFCPISATETFNTTNYGGYDTRNAYIYKSSYTNGDTTKILNDEAGVISEFPSELSNYIKFIPFNDDSLYCYLQRIDNAFWILDKGNM